MSTAYIDDKAWFDQHPNAIRRIRRFIPGEIPAHLDDGTLAWVVIEGLAPGIRHKRFLCHEHMAAELLAEAGRR